MEQELNTKFNEEISRYKNTLLFCAKQCDWDTFQEEAGRLFDYCETIEMSEIKKRFLNISKIILAVLVVFLIAIIKINPDVYPKLARINELLLLTAVAICCFEVYFFHVFRMFVKGKSLYYDKRREEFVRDIESDFKNMPDLSGREAHRREEKPLPFAVDLPDRIPEPSRSL